MIHPSWPFVYLVDRLIGNSLQSGIYFKEPAKKRNREPGTSSGHGFFSNPFPQAGS